MRITLWKSWKAVPCALAIGAMAASLTLTVPAIAAELQFAGRRAHPDACHHTGQPCDVWRNCSDNTCGCDNMNLCATTQ